MKQKFVVGDGLSALSFCFYNPTYTLITSGKPKRNIPFVFIHNCKTNRDFLRDLGISNFETEQVAVDFSAGKDAILLGKGITNNSAHQSGTNRVGYVDKNFTMEALRITEQDLCAKIHEQMDVNIITSEIESISGSHITFKEKEDESHPHSFGSTSLPYSEIIYTKHFLTLQKLMPHWDCGRDIELHDLYYKDIEFHPSFASTIKYFGEEKEYSKFVSNAINGLAAFEYRSGEREDVKTLKDARYSGILRPPPENILLVGRSATANPHWQIEDSVFVAREGYWLHKKMTEQKRYDHFVEDLSGVTGAERLSGLVLHCHSELSELIREISWKMNSKTNKAKTSVLEEGIDVFKLLMAILHHFNYTPREISEMFYSKSKTMWNRTLDEFYGGM